MPRQSALVKCSQLRRGVLTRCVSFCTAFRSVAGGGGRRLLELCSRHCLPSAGGLWGERPEHRQLQVRTVHPLEAVPSFFAGACRTLHIGQCHFALSTVQQALLLLYLEMACTLSWPELFGSPAVHPSAPPLLRAHLAPPFFPTLPLFPTPPRLSPAPRRTTLPLKKGLSSSAALCVLVARAFNQAYGLRLTTRGEMQYAYDGERMTPSQVGAEPVGADVGAECGWQLWVLAVGKPGLSPRWVAAEADFSPSALLLLPCPSCPWPLPSTLRGGPPCDKPLLAAPIHTSPRPAAATPNAVRQDGPGVRLWLHPGADDIRWRCAALRTRHAGRAAALRACRPGGREGHSGNPGGAAGGPAQGTVGSVLGPPRRLGAFVHGHFAN